MKNHKILIAKNLKSETLFVKKEIDKVLEKSEINIVSTTSEFRDYLAKSTPDLVITEYKSPSLAGLEILKRTHEKSQHIPVIFLTANADEEAIVECMKAGAADFITKEHSNRLGAAVLTAIKDSSTEEQKSKNSDTLTASEEVYRSIWANSPLPMFVFDLEKSNFLEVNNSALELYGYTREGFLSLALREISPVEDLKAVAETVAANQHYHPPGNWWHLKKSGEIMYVKITSHFIDFNGRKACNMQIRDVTRHKKAWEAMESSEEKFRALVENNPDIFFQTDMEGILYEISPSVDRYLGYSREELVGNPINDMYYDINERERLLNLLLGKGQVEDYTVRFRTRNGDITVASMNARLLYNSQGQPDLIDGSLRDINERANKEEVLRKSEEKFRALFDDNSVVKLIVDPETHQIVDTNYSASRFYGYSKESIKQMKIGEITTIRSEDLAAMYKKIRASGYLQYETQHCCNDGTMKDVDVNASKVIISGKDYIYLMVQDITYRKEAEQHYRLLSKTIEQSPVGIMITDQHGRIEYVNPRFTKITGHSLPEIKDKKQWFLYTGKYSDRTYSDMWETVLSGKDWKGELPVKRKNGDHYWEDVRISPVKNDKRQITHVVTICDDVTARHKLWEELSAEKAKIEISDKMKSSFITNISNEVRTPLNGIIGFAEMLVNTEISNENKQNYIDIIKKSSTRLLNTITSYMDISMILSGKTKIFNKQFHLNTLLNNIKEEFSDTCSTKDVELNIHMPKTPDNVTLNTDGDIVFRVMSHLLCNAVKFTEKGSIDFGFRIRNNIPEFFVTDTGIGIEYKKINSLFNYTTHHETTSTHGYEYRGLGLPIARGLVELLEGEIFIEPGTTKGTTVFFKLPPEVIITNIPEEEKEKEEVKSKHPLLTKNAVILVAEDDDFNYKFIETVLHRADFRVLRAENGVEAVNICYNNPDVSLVLMDLKMPIMGGIEATRQIKNFLPALPVIALTAFVSSEDEQEAFVSGCEDYIKKPVDRSRLLHSVGDLLGNKVN